MSNVEEGVRGDCLRDEYLTADSPGRYSMQATNRKRYSAIVEVFMIRCRGEEEDQDGTEESDE